MNVLLFDSSINFTINKFFEYLFQAILRLSGNSLKVECDDWYGRNLDAEQREDDLKCIKTEKRLALIEEELQEQSKKSTEQSKELAETNKKLIELEQEKSKQLAETNKKLIELEQENSKQLAEANKKSIELEQEQSNPVPKNIKGNY